MRDHGALEEILEEIDGRSYGEYRKLKGRWSLPGFELGIDYVQRDPFAPPTRVRVRLESGEAALPEPCRSSSPRRVGAAWLLARRFAEEAARTSSRRGSGRSGEIEIETPGQEVLVQTAVRIGPEGDVEARFGVGLPARGRRVLAREAAALLLEDLPRVVRSSLLGGAFAPGELVLHAETNEDAEALRGMLDGKGLIAFVADASVLPRRSGIDDRPLAGSAVVPFRAPPTLRVTLEAPNAGPVAGMGIPRGVTLVVGGGFHGKSTLLRALERGVYNHPPGDGRERVVTAPGAVKVRAEEGRSVAAVDVSPFIGDLPGGGGTTRFSTPNASGSTSHAAAIVEAIEAGASALLIDEDTAATNLMIRDRRMQALVPRAREPITPFIDRVKELHGERGVSAVLVLGGSGDYLDVADTVVAMSAYVPEDVTDAAREVARAHPTGRVRETPAPLRPSPPRVPEPDSIDPSRGRRSEDVRVRKSQEIHFGRSSIDLSAVEQLVSAAQTRAVAEALLLARRRFIDGRRDLPAILDAVMAEVASGGLEALGRVDAGDLALFRRFELAAALNRLRTLEVRAPTDHRAAPA